MIAIALKDKTINVSSYNKSSDEEKGLFSIWATKECDGKSLKVFESEDEETIDMMKKAIDFAVEKGEFLISLEPGE